MSLSRFLASEWTRAQDEHLNLPAVLPHHQLMQEIIKYAPTPSVELAQTFANAWQTMQRHDIPIDAAEFTHDRGALFKDWFTAVTHALSADLIPAERLGDALVKQSCQPQTPLLLIEFEQLTAVEQRYLQFAAQHVAISLCQSNTLNAWHGGHIGVEPSMEKITQATLCGYANLNDELAAAAGWAYQIKKKQADATIGIVVPNLTQHYARVQRQIAAVLTPHAGSSSQSFDMSAGVTLDSQPVWRHARLYLQGLVTGFTPETCLQLGHSPFMQLAPLLNVAQRWPKTLRRQVTTAQLEACIAGLKLAALGTGKASFATWLFDIKQCLQQVGWPNLSMLGSNQYQAAQSVLQSLEFMQQSSSAAQMSLQDALLLLDSVLAQQLFAPQRAHNDILVLGLLETTGLQFSHLWVVGMDENSLPSKSVANPFLPRKLCQRYNVPRASQFEELAFARRLLNHWQHASGELRFSYTLSADDNEQLPSALLSHLPVDEIDPCVQPFWQCQPKTQLESYVDTHGDPLQGTDTRGGTGLLQAQAQCPFKAYAQFRLGLRRPDDVVDFPNALARGNLLHDALQTLLTRFPDQSALGLVDEQTVTDICSQTLKKHPIDLPDLYIEQEIKRLSQLILAWLAIEASRQPFSAVSLEEAFELKFDQLTIRIRVDRIDRIEQQLVVIDYKSGQVSMQGVMQTPTTEPQLPAYSLIDEQIAGAYYAEVRHEPRLLGVAADAAQLEGARTYPTSNPWPEQRAQWQAELSTLARRFAAGDAQVAPVAGACRYCHLGSFCRVEQPQ